MPKKSSGKTTKMKDRLIGGHSIVASRERRRKRMAEIKREKRNNVLTAFVIFFFAVLLIFSTYAWLSTALNVHINTFKMQVSKNSGLTISLDGINFGSYVEISADTLIHELEGVYPSNTNQWAGSGLIPVSTMGARNNNTPRFDIYISGGVRYRSRNKTNGFVTVELYDEKEASEYNRYIAFDIFLKNDSGSPISDNLYMDETSFIELDPEPEDGEEVGEEMDGLVNSLRVGFLKMGTVPKKSPANIVQGITCNNDCKTIIYEPNSTKHSALSIERAANFGVDLVDGEPYPTFAWKDGSGQTVYIKNTISGSPLLDPKYFALQNTIKESDFTSPLFKIPDGITKVRVYLWVEGQDIDSLETNSTGAELIVSIDLSKDNSGYADN